MEPHAIRTFKLALRSSEMNIYMWLATWGGSLPGQLRYVACSYTELVP
jgi:hypothetical protein